VCHGHRARGCASDPGREAIGTVEIAFAAREDFATSLVDAQGGVIAMATATAPVIPLARARSAA
jgi:hypothetical protein